MKLPPRSLSTLAVAAALLGAWPGASALGQSAESSPLRKLMDGLKLDHKDAPERTKAQEKISDDAVVAMEFPLHYAEARPLHIEQSTEADKKPIIIPGVADTLLKILFQPGTKDAHAPGLPDVYPHQTRNSVIVLDTKSHEAFYRDLIKQLDKKRQLIEISVAVIDIDSDASLAFGTEATAGANKSISEGGRGGVRASSFGNGRNLNPLVDALYEAKRGLPIADLNGNTVEGSDFSVAGMLASGGSRILARIRTLEGEGKARMMTRPSILTLSGMEAAFSDESRLFIPVPGVNFADLYEVPVASEVKVIPRLSDPNAPEGSRMVQMVVMVDEGGTTGSTKASTLTKTPVVTSSSVTTQAVVMENGSLLLGGRYRQNQALDDARVPVLGRIPVLGNLFKQKSVRKGRAQRFFLISPRLIDPAQLKRNENNEAFWGYDPEDIRTAHQQATAPAPAMDESPATTKELRATEKKRRPLFSRHGK